MPVQHSYPIGKGEAVAFTEVHLKTSLTNVLHSPLRDIFPSNPKPYRDLVRENECLYGRSEVMHEELRRQEAAYAGMTVARRRRTEWRVEAVLKNLQRRRC